MQSLSSSPPGQDWLPLDNAAKIYPTASSKLSPAVFRISARLRAPVSLIALQQAADALVRRCPYFQVHLRRGVFWYFLQRHADTPQVQLLDGSALQAMRTVAGPGTCCGSGPGSGQSRWSSPTS